jgi:hypothetical protein
MTAEDFTMFKRPLQSMMWPRVCQNIYAVVENRKADHQAYVVELEGIIFQQPIYVLIELGSKLSYVSPQVIEHVPYRERSMQKHGWFS